MKMTRDLITGLGYIVRKAHVYTFEGVQRYTQKLD